MLSLHIKQVRLKEGPKCMFDLPCGIHWLISECNKSGIQSSYFLLLFFPQKAADKHSGETLANVQGNLVLLAFKL